MPNDAMNASIRATDAQSLAHVARLLHDGKFTVSGIACDLTQNAVTIPVRRLFQDRPERIIRTGLLSRIVERDWFGSVVTVHRVRDWHVAGDQGIDDYSFDSWTYGGGSIRVESCERLSLHFDVEDLDVELRDTAVCGTERFRRWPLGIETTTGEMQS